MIRRDTKRLKKLKRPPISIRYCLACEKDTEWKYNPNVVHSRCVECGGLLSERPEEEK